MITTHTKLLVVLAGAGLAATASAQELMVFPNDGQDKEQQQQDEFTCFNWAKGETGERRDRLRPDGCADGHRAAAAASSPKGRR